MSGDNLWIVELDPNGDVSLELHYPDGKVHMLMSSNVLTLASPVFAVMFSSQFKGGLGSLYVDQRTPKSLPDEGEPAFIAFYTVLYYQTWM